MTEMCVTAVPQEHGRPVCNIAGTVVSGDWWSKVRYRRDKAMRKVWVINIGDCR